MDNKTVRVSAFGKDWQVREGANDDLNVVAEVYGVDGYRLKEMKAAGFSPRTIVDVGGHIGSFSVLAHSLWPEAAIYAIEPNPISYRLLRENAPFAECLQVALRYDDADLLADGGVGTGSGFMTNRDDFDAKAEIKHRQDGHEYQIAHQHVELMTFEAVLERFGIERVDLLKLDCEGSEVHLLENISPDAASRISSVVGEYHLEGGFAAFKSLAQGVLPQLELYGGNGQEIGPFWSRPRNGAAPKAASSGRAADWTASFGTANGLPALRHLYRDRIQSLGRGEYFRRLVLSCPRGGRACELVAVPAVASGPEGVGGWTSLWLSRRGVHAYVASPNPVLLEELRQVSAAEDARVSFASGDIQNLYQESAPHFDLIHHSDLLSVHTVPEIRSMLAQQVAMAERVVFRVPSMYHEGDAGQGNVRLLPMEEWGRILEPFEVLELGYCGLGTDGEDGYGGRSHILGVLRGQTVTPELRAMMDLPDEPFPPGISAVVHTRNEGRKIEDCLESLRGWADQIIVCDMESEDDTLAIARRYTGDIIHHCLIPNFDQARNAAAMRARHRWVFYLDADERVPPALGRSLRALADRQLGALPEERFAAVAFPFRHHFAGRWMQSMYPGYTTPRLFANGKFFFSPRLHAGVQVDGQSIRFPADDPGLALVHYSYDSIAHYLEKMGRYTDGEALNMDQDGREFSWQSLVDDFVASARGNYDILRGAEKDGVHGFLYAFLSGFYRLVQHGKLFEKRFSEGRLQPGEDAVPPRLDEVLEYALRAARREPRPAPTALSIQGSVSGAGEADPAPFVWSGPLLSPSGYGEHSRSQVFDLEEAGANFAAQILPWGQETDLREDEISQLEQVIQRPVAQGFVHLIHEFPRAFYRHPQAGISIGRTVFETDRLPRDWVRQCNQMDYVWVTSEFSREAFAASGVAPEKLRVFPEILNARDFAAPAESALLRPFKCEGKFVFLGIFEWTWKKGWDVLLRAFHDAFDGRDDAVLVLKVWSSLHLSDEDIRRQAATWANQTLGWDLLADPRVVFIQEQLPRAEVHALMWSCDAYVLASHGEGWGRTCMEAMACGRPVIATNWSSITDYLTPENGYPVGYDLVPVSEEGWRQVPLFKGHRWAAPRHDELVATMRRVIDEPDEAAAKGRKAREDILSRYTGGRVGRRMWDEIQRLLGTISADPAEIGGQEAASPGGEQTSIALVERAAPARPVRVRWEGEFFAWHSFALINRELGLRLLDSPDCELSLVPSAQSWFDASVDPRFHKLAERFWSPLSGPAEVHVRHAFPPHLDAPPPEGKFVLIQPWEFGYLPADWVRPILASVDEVWCMSNYVRDVFVSSGVPEERLQIVPWGVRQEVFHPGALPHVFTDEPGAERLGGDLGPKGARDRFVFLFVGGTLERKGIDILLDAYALAFSDLDEVCLVIKDTGTTTVYSKGNASERILSLLEDSKHPAMIYLDSEVSDFELAGIYSACDCYVQPYRGEGFCLPVLEAMACGLPAIVPEGGPTDDFVDEEVGWRVRAERRSYGSMVEGHDGQVRGRIGPMECVGPTWNLEVGVRELARLLRHVASQREVAARKGEAAARRVEEHWTWDHTAARVRERLGALREGEPRSRRVPDGEDRPEKSSVEVVRAELLHIWVPPSYQATNSTEQPGTRASANGPSAVRSEPTISLCMIVRDEERVLGECLSSAKPWFDEIILVDTGSKDRTVEIAREHGAKVFHFPWNDSFSDARNVSLEHATGEWVFWMDADDTLPEACGRKLRELALLAEDRTTGFVCQVHIPPKPGESGFTIVDHVKLFRNRPEHRFLGRIHEQILEPIQRAGGEVERSDVYVVHSGYDYSPEGQAKKRARDLLLLEKDLADRPDHPFVLFNIGMTAYHMKDFPRAVEALERCLEKSGPRESTVRKVYAMLAGCGLETRDLTMAKSYLERGLDDYPRDPELLFRGGVIFRELGDLERAERCYVTLLTEPERGHIDSLDVTMTGFKAHHNLALIYMDMGRFEMAERHFAEALRHGPDFEPSRAGLLDARRHLGR